MKHTSDITDEQLTRFLSGATTADEETEVLDYAAAADENAEELLDIAAAIRTQQRSQEKKNQTFRPMYLVAAVLVLVIAAGAAYLFMGNSVTPQPATATPVTAEVVTADTTSEIPIAPANLTQQQKDAVQQQMTQQAPDYTMEVQNRVTASQSELRYADSTVSHTPDTNKTCLKIITL